MKKIAAFLGVALALWGIGPLAAGQGPGGAVPSIAAAGQLAAGSPISHDDEDGDDSPEGTGVVDPVPQDDGSAGVDDGTGT